MIDSERIICLQVLIAPLLPHLRVLVMLCLRFSLMCSTPVSSSDEFLVYPCRDCMTKPAITIRKKAAIAFAAGLMLNHKVGSRSQSIDPSLLGMGACKSGSFLEVCWFLPSSLAPAKEKVRILKKKVQPCLTGCCRWPRVFHLDLHPIVVRQFLAPAPISWVG
jgi:hypothetical protein